MAIDLACTSSAGRVTFSIVFRNASDEPHKLPFSNRSRKAEYWGLRLEDAQGQPVKPQRTMIVNPRVPDPDVHPLASGETWTYELTGELTDAGLEFPAAIFPLRKGESYLARFAYKGVASNQTPVNF